MNQDPNSKVQQDSTTDTPENWEGEEMRPDNRYGPKTGDTAKDADVAGWNEGQMAEQHKDGSRTTGPTDEEIVEESSGGLSGGGVNPGGGERWAERDKK